MDKNKVNVPKIRFPGFTDPWEQRKFEDIFKLSQGLQIPISQRFLTEGENKYFYITNEFLKSTCNEKYYIENPPQSVICNQEDILMTRTGNTGIVVTDVEGCFHNNFFKIQYEKELFDKYFIVQLLSTESMRRRILNSAGSSTIPDLSHKSFYKLDSFFPKIDEQNKISEVILNLDNLITLHQHKLNHLQDKKKSLLQKMFPQNGENFPELRFPGFTDPWEQHKLGELLIPSTEKNNTGKYTQDDVLAASLGTELTKKHIFFGLRSTEESIKNYRIVNKGDVIYTKSPIKGYPNGIIKTNKGIEGIVPSLYCVYNSVSDVNSSIIQSYFEDKSRLDAYLYPLVNVGARNNVNITDLGFLEGNICIPHDIDEQNRIVDFIEKLSNLITLHQRKLNHLQQQKKGLLQQMFI